MPISVDTIATDTPTLILNHAALTHRSSPKKSSYHRQESPAGGKWSTVLGLNETGITTMSGSRRKVSTAQNRKFNGVRYRKNFMPTYFLIAR
jgi:hypothetical protein